MFGKTTIAGRLGVGYGIFFLLLAVTAGLA
jgi:hypothetical protein